jgi:hypothetical protein
VVETGTMFHKIFIISHYNIINNKKGVIIMTWYDHSFMGGKSNRKGFYPSNFDCRISSQNKSVTKTEDKETS